MNSFAHLVREHDAIAHRADLLVALVGEIPQPTIAAGEVEQLDRMVRKHLELEDVSVYATVEVTGGTRHAVTAADAAKAFEVLKQDWTGYLERWAAQDIAEDWAGFGKATRAMLPRLRARLDWETAVLYSLALHHAILTPHDDPASPPSAFPAPSWQA